MSVSAVSPTATSSVAPGAPQQTLLDKLKKQAEEEKRKEDAKPKAKDGEALSPAATIAVISGRWKPPKAEKSESSESSSSGGTNYDSIA